MDPVRLLIVDQEIPFRTAMATALRGAGHEVMVAADGRSALDVLQTAHPSLVLLDLAMPQADGVALLRAIRSDASLQGLPVLPITGPTDRAVLDEARRLGISGCLMKQSFSVDELLAAISSCIGRPAKATDT